MDVATLKKQIMKNELNHFYIFTGEEVVVRDTYVRKIIEVSNLQSSKCSSVLEAFKTLKNKSLLTITQRIYIISNDKNYIADFESYTELLDVLKDSIIILLYDTIDKRSKFYKAFTDSIVTFEKLSKDILIKYIQNDIELSHQKADILAEICECDYSRILLEIDKLKHYCSAHNMSPDLALVKLVTEGIIYSNPYDAVFDFADAVLNRQYAKSFELLKECKDGNEATLIMLSVLYTSFKQTLQVQSCHSSDIAKATGLTKWQINKAKAHLDRYKNGELVKAMRLISKLVSDIKIGKIEDSVAIDYALVNIL